MKLEIILRLGIMIFVTGLTISCDKYLNVEPEDRFLSETIYKSEAAANAALNGIYLNMAKTSLYGENLSAGLIDCMAQYYQQNDNWKLYMTYSYKEAIVQASFEDIWRSAYVGIMNANSFIENIEKSTDLMSEDKKSILLGEAYGLRAFFHFDLLRLYGPMYTNDSTATAIPYLKKATEDIQPILPANEVIAEILHDIQTSASLLAKDPIRTEGVVAVGGLDALSDFYKLRNRRYNYYANLALKARVLLWKGDKTNALQTAKEAIGETGDIFTWTPENLSLPDIETPDRVFSSEVIFGVQNYDMYNVQKSLFLATLTSNKILAPSRDKLDLIFEKNENDYRYRMNWKEGTSAGKDYKTFYKYDDVADQSALFRNFQPLIRLSELYYIIAECEPDRSSTISYLNLVRQNRGIPSLSTDANINTEISKEYEKEFLGEGQTFFYYKRTGVKTVTNGKGTSTVNLDATKYVVPLPLSETQNR